MTQESAAIYFNCNQSFISQIENGISAPSEKIISKILADDLIKRDGLELVSNNLLNEPTEKYGMSSFIDIMQKQANSLAVKDEQINRLITLLENQLNKEK